MATGPHGHIPPNATHEPLQLRWTIVTLVATVAILLIGMLLLLPMMGRPNYEVGLYDAIAPVAAVEVRGARWPTSAPVYLADQRMVAVGRTDEGHLLYTDSWHAMGGGGGGAPETTGDMRASQVLFVRTGKNRYLQVKGP